MLLALLLALTVLPCMPHLAQPVHAAELSRDDRGADGHAPDCCVADGCSHHCQHMPLRAPPAPAATVSLRGAPLFVRPVHALRSRAQAPPIQPPIA